MLPEGADMLGSGVGAIDDGTQFNQMNMMQKQNLSWIEWICALEGYDFLVEIEKDFIRDEFNMIGIKD